MNNGNKLRVLYVSDYYRGGARENGRPDWELNIAKVLELSSQIIADFFTPIFILLMLLKNNLKRHWQEIILI